MSSPKVRGTMPRVEAPETQGSPDARERARVLPPGGRARRPDRRQEAGSQPDGRAAPGVRTQGSAREVGKEVGQVKKLDLAREREIRQLIWVADDYLARASAARSENGKVGDEAAAFTSEVPPDAKTAHRVRLSSDMTSAAIRLGTVEEVLAGSGHPRPGYLECDRYFGRKKRPPGSSFPGPAWLHLMLRNNASHEEPPADPKTDLARRREERQAFVVGLTFVETYATLEKIAAELREHLRQKHGLVCPTTAR